MKLNTAQLKKSLGNYLPSGSPPLGEGRLPQVCSLYHQMPPLQKATCQCWHYFSSYCTGPTDLVRGSPFSFFHRLETANRDIINNFGVDSAGWYMQQDTAVLRPNCWPVLASGLEFFNREGLVAKMPWRLQVAKARRCRVGGGCSCTQAHSSGVTCWRIQDFHAAVWAGVFWANLRKRTGELLVGLNNSYFSVACMQTLFKKHLVSKKSEIYRKALGKSELQKRWVLLLSFTGKGAHLLASDERKLTENLCHLVSTKLEGGRGAGFSPLH